MLISYTKLNVNVITAIITVILFSAINYTGTNINLAYKNIKNSAEATSNGNSQTIAEVKTEESANKTNENLVNTKEKAKTLWQIEIPQINLVAPIVEGTSKEVMDKYVGHFDNTASWNGNVGLAGHNRRLPS